LLLAFQGQEQQQLLQRHSLKALLYVNLQLQLLSCQLQSAQQPP
jgi:hypothetical protein